MEALIKMFDNVDKMTFSQSLLSMIIAVILGIILKYIYQKNQLSINYSRSFPIALILLPIIVCMIMIAIGSSLVLSLGLVGSLSILRFRSAIKDIRDMVFLFIAIAIGLTTGSGNYLLAVTGLVFFSAITIIFSYFDLLKPSANDYLLSITGTNCNQQDIDSILQMLEQSCSRFETRSIANSNNLIDLSFTLQLPKYKDIYKLISTIRDNIGKDIEIRAVTPDTALIM